MASAFYRARFPQPQSGRNSDANPTGVPASDDARRLTAAAVYRKQSTTQNHKPPSILC